MQAASAGYCRHCPFFRRIPTSPAESTPDLNLSAICGVKCPEFEVGIAGCGAGEGKK
jgi:hypothetical protein